MKRRRNLKPRELVVLETTVPPWNYGGAIPGLVERVKWLEGRRLPPRVLSGKDNDLVSISRLREFSKVIGGADEDCGFVAYGVYKRFISNPSMVSTAKTAVLIKMMKGCFGDVNIALSNERFNVAEEIGVEFYEARSYANH